MGMKLDKIRIFSWNVQSRLTIGLSAFLMLTANAFAAPGYDQDRNELEWVMERLKELA